MIRPAFLLSAAACLLATSPAPAQSQWRDQDAVFKGVNEGRLLPFPQLLARVQRRVGGTFIGSDFDHFSGTYRFKFMDDGEVTWVDVDGRSGEILGRGGR